MRRMMAAVGLGLSAVLLTGGCQLVGGGGHDAKPSKTSKNTGGRPAQAAPPAAPQPSAGTPPVSKQITMPIPGEQGETFTLGYSSLRVTGQLAVLTLVWTPHGVGTDTISPYDMLGESTPGSEVSLIDTVNLKRYVIVSDSNDHALQKDYVTSETGNNQPLTMTYWFAAPAADASVNVVLGDQPVFESVRVTR